MESPSRLHPMSATSERVRAELEAETGVDFRRYADDALIDAVTGWSGIVALATEFGISLGFGALVAVIAIAVAFIGNFGFEARVGVIVGGLIVGLGVILVMFALRGRRRAPSEAEKVFELTETMVDRVAEDVATGRITVTAAQAARGLAIVAAAPALTRVAQRRFPLVGTLAAPAVGALLTRTLARVWPAASGGLPLTGLEGTARRLNDAVAAARRAVIPKLATTVRWATLPLIIAGTVLGLIGLGVAAVSIFTA